ncbi:ROK family transcriptional regulator [Tenggerimyces flavus]|uniref:ROK family transcriptional regulator n=1 Tax=Tenggerimyces flavus TaxID=1708749 RepID=A0ABV7YPX6_9ACTN|nr:ROK family transcriptional regulator [Tenggerimyces flavus]MBM7789490.1 putative NBD/HSP70 family sugar kinase [Tenggerimyces flavus]
MGSEREGPASPALVRQLNDRKAFDLLLSRGPLTRPQLRSLTGLSRPTVGDLVDRMEAAGLVAVVGESGTDRRGPNAALYGVVADRAFVAGVEVRPRVVLAVVSDVTGRTVGSAQVPFDASSSPVEVVHAAVVAASASASVSALRTVVVGTPGLVDPSTGDLSFAAFLPTWHANLLPGLRSRLDVPVLLENEVNLVGLAEHRLGAMMGRSSFALLSLGSGIGMAVVLGGQLYRGASGGAGETAYLPVGTGTFQELVGGASVLALARAHGVDSSGGLEGVVIAGSEAFLDELADRVAVGVAGICSILDPGTVVLAGTVGRAGGTALASRVATGVAERVPLPTEVVAGTVSGAPVLRGAVLVALDLLHAETFGPA